MKIADLRRAIEACSEDKLRLLVSEIYKALPKKVIENKNIDQLILNTEEVLQKRKKANKPVELPDFKSLARETEIFIDHAYKQHYFAPNKEIHKKERPKWRFIVKRLTEQLIVTGRQEEYAAESSTLLEKLYAMLCHSSRYYLFSTEDPFNSVYSSQPDYLRYVLAVKVNSRQPQVWVREAIQLVVNEGTDLQTNTDSLTEVLLEFLQTAPLKELAVEQCDQLIKEMKANKPVKSKANWDSEYRFKEKINNLRIVKFFCKIRLYEYDAAIIEFRKSYKEYQNNPEVDLYILLEYLFQFELKDYWVREYETAITNGIKPRESLQRTYRYIDENGQFPE